MTDFLAFRNLAKAAFPRFNISAMIWEKEEAKSLNALRFRLKAHGPGLSSAVTVEAHSAAAAVEDLRVALAKARRSHDTEAAIRDISRTAGGLDEDAQAHIRRQLTNCPLLAFEGKVAYLRQQARASAAEQQAA